MKPSLIAMLMALCVAAGAQQITVRNIRTIDFNTIAYPNLAGNTTSSQPHKGTITLKDGTSVSGKITFFKKKEEFSRVKVNTGEEKREIEAAQIAAITIDPIITEAKYPNNFKNPEKNFQTGYILLPDGTKLTGKVAQVRDFSDYDFFVYTVLFLPEGSTVASTFNGGRLSGFTQDVAGVTQVWDGYADGYLRRMVDGRYRLSRNPYSTTKNEFFTSLKNAATDSLAKGAAQASLQRGIKDGKNLNETIENAANSSAVVTEALGSIDINRKEYLIFDTRDNSIIVLNKNTFKENAQRLSSACTTPPSKDVMDWDKIEAFVQYLNANCQ